MRRASVIAAIASAVCLAAPIATASAGTTVSAFADSCVNTSARWTFSPPLEGEVRLHQFGTATARYKSNWTCGFAGSAAHVDPNYPGVNPGAGVRIWLPEYFVIPSPVSYSYQGNCASATLSGGATDAFGTVSGGATIELVHRDPNANAGAMTETVQLARLGDTDSCVQQLGIGVSTVTGPSASWSPVPVERGDEAGNN